MTRQTGLDFTLPMAPSPAVLRQHSVLRVAMPSALHCCALQSWVPCSLRPATSVTNVWLLCTAPDPGDQLGGPGEAGFRLGDFSADLPFTFVGVQARPFPDKPGQGTAWHP